MNDAPRVGVVLVNYRTSRMLNELFDAWRAERSEASGRLATIVVVDNDPEGHDDAFAAAEIKYIGLERNRGYAYGVNRGWMDTTEDYVLLLNPDAKVSLEAIDKLACTLDLMPTVGAVAPLHSDPDGQITNPYHTIPSWLDLLAHRTHLYRFAWAKRRVDAYFMRELDGLHAGLPVRDVDQPPASCLLLRRAAINGAVPMDEYFPFLFNDVDLARRLKQSGWRTVVLPAAECVHVPSTSGRYLGVLGAAENYVGVYRYVRKWEGQFRGELVRLSLLTELLLMRRAPESRAAFRALVQNRSIFEQAGDERDPVRPYWPPALNRAS